MKALALLLALSLTSCIGLGARRISFEYSDGRKVIVYCQSDGRCQDGNVIIDNRGPLAAVWAAGTAALGRVYDRIKDEPTVK